MPAKNRKRTNTNGAQRRRDDPPSPRAARRPASSKRRARLQRIYRALFQRWGPQHWWPGETPFEVMVGAILTQNTAWRNVEQAIANLKRAKLLSPQALRRVPPERLARRIRPSGYFNVKTRRLKHFIEFFFREAGGDEAALRTVPTALLRERLLAVNGLGPETADSILLYALNRPVFVVDAYTRRILARHGLIQGGESYEEMRALFERHLPRRRRLYNEFHALIVRTGHRHCRRTARCAGCPLARFPHDETRGGRCLAEARRRETQA